jgi:hypothetical protein
LLPDRCAGSTVRAPGYCDDMAEIRGKYVYDDDFTPGHKSDGGLSQNLYNDEGRVETHATFIPDEEAQYEYEPDHEPSGLSDEDRRRAEELCALLGAALVAIAIAAAPHVKRWWLDTAWPGLKKLVARKPKAVPARDELAALALTALSKVEPADISTAIELAIDDTHIGMSSEEAQQRLLAMLAASAFIAEQRRILSNVRLDDQAELPELRRALEQLSSPEVIENMNRMLEANPTLLDERASAEFMRMFGGGGVLDGEYVPLRSQTVRDALHLTEGRGFPDEDGQGDLAPV